MGNNAVFIPNEVIAEIIYVLEKVYHVDKSEISITLIEFFKYENIKVADLDVIEEVLVLYGNRRLDFVDTLLYGYYRIKGCEIYSFDKKLNKLLEEK